MFNKCWNKYSSLGSLFIIQIVFCLNHVTTSQSRIFLSLHVSISVVGGNFEKNSLSRSAEVILYVMTHLKGNLSCISQNYWAETNTCSALHFEEYILKLESLLYFFQASPVHYFGRDVSDIYAGFSLSSIKCFGLFNSVEKNENTI